MKIKGFINQEYAFPTSHFCVREQAAFYGKAPCSVNAT